MRSPVLTALVHPLNLAVLGLSLLAGLLAAWWLFPLGLVVWGAMVVTVSRDARLQFSYRMENREPLARRKAPVERHQHDAGLCGREIQRQVPVRVPRQDRHPRPLATARRDQPACQPVRDRRRVGEPQRALAGDDELPGRLLARPVVEKVVKAHPRPRLAR